MSFDHFIGFRLPALHSLASTALSALIDYVSSSCDDADASVIKEQLLSNGHNQSAVDAGTVRRALGRGITCSGSEVLSICRKIEAAHSFLNEPLDITGHGSTIGAFGSHKMAIFPPQKTKDALLKVASSLRKSLLALESGITVGPCIRPHCSIIKIRYPEK